MILKRPWNRTPHEILGTRLLDPAFQRRCRVKTGQPSPAHTEQQDRYYELAIFGQDVLIPGPVLAQFWEPTAGWSTLKSRRFSQRLADLALLAEHRTRLAISVRVYEW